MKSFIIALLFFTGLVCHADQISHTLNVTNLVSEVGSISITGLVNTNLPTTTVYTVPIGADGIYDVSMIVQVTATATTGGTVAPNANWTDVSGATSSTMTAIIGTALGRATISQKIYSTAGSVITISTTCVAPSLGNFTYRVDAKVIKL